MKTRLLAALLLLSAVVTVLYWLNYYSGGDVRVSDARWYTAYEGSFPVADGWMAFCLFGAGIGLWTGRAWGARFGLLAGSALLYLAAMDITFDVENGLYALAAHSDPMKFEIVINVWSLALGVATVLLSWRRSVAEAT
ncbi:MAG: hypothetical protein ABSC92_08245 [Rhizomicrobium sp.]|jgi:hypothetical protein